MDIGFELTPEDIVKFNMYLYDYTPKLARRRQQMRFGAPALWIGVMGILIFFSHRPIMDQIWTWLPLLILSGLWVIYYQGFARRNFQKVVTRMYAGKKGAPPVKRTVRLSISSSDVRVTYPAGHEPTPWKDIKDVVSDDDHIYFLTDTAAAHLIPRRAFGDSFAYKKFIETATGYFRSARQP